MPHTREWYKKWRMPTLREGFNDRGYWIDHLRGLQVGNFFDISKFVYLQCRNGVEIGNYVEIGPHASILSESSIDMKKGRVTLMDYSKVGAGSTVMPGATIKPYGVLAANSFLQAGTTIGRKELWGGSPAKKIKDLEGLVCGI